MKNLTQLGICCLGLLVIACGGSKGNLSDAQLIANGMVFPPDYQAKTQSLKVLSWNVEHFVDEYNNPYINNNREDNPPVDMIERVALLSEALKLIDADIVVLQEFESENFARALAREKFPELGYTFFTASESPTWYMNVVVMSRVPLGTHYSYGRVSTPIIGKLNEDGSQASQNQINTRMWSVDVFPNPDYAFTLSGVHLKAGRGDENAGYRKGQFRFLKGQFARFIAERPKANILLVGDFNSYPDSPELQEFLLPENGVRMINPTEGQVLFTHTADKPERQLDYILYNDHMKPEIVDNSYKIPMPFEATEMRRIADHLPLVIEFELTDK
ncbi:MAG: endonuclease/exonuclease/phosphatase family protein [Sumerlaeia bacterium]